MAAGRSRTSPLAREMRSVLPVLADLTGWINHHAAVGPTPGSPLAQQINDERQQIQPDESPHVGAAAETIGLLTLSACGHLDGLRRLLGAKVEVPHPHALVSLARGAIENAALAAWIAEPDLQIDERARRFASYELTGHQEHFKLGPDSADSKVRVDALKKEALGRGWALKVPTKTKLVASMFNDDAMPSDDSFGEFGYRVLSAIAHGSSHTLLEFAHGGNDHGHVIGATGAQAFTLCVLPSAAAVQLLGYRLVETFGLPAAEWDALVQRCLAVDTDHLIGPSRPLASEAPTYGSVNPPWAKPVSSAAPSRSSEADERP